MTGWFAVLPLDRKLVVSALVITTVALVIALGGLAILDQLYAQSQAVVDARSLARVLGENLGAAVSFDNTVDARDVIGAVRLRANVQRVCVYDSERTLFVSFVNAGEPCPESIPAAARTGLVGATAAVTYRGREYGTVYVERDLSDLRERALVVGAAGGLMLLLAAAVAFALATRVHGAVSRPILALVDRARQLGRGQDDQLPPRAQASDEIAELVAAFDDMVHRVREANARLTAGNEALTREIEERRRIELERIRLLERERQASRAKDEFLAAVSHELRTPLNAILGWVQILATAASTEQTRARALASLSRNAEAQRRVIEDLIDVSRIVTGKLQLRPNAVDLRVVVEAAVDVVMPAARARQIELRTELQASPAVVQGDADRLQQIVWNLLSNAVKFTKPGGSVTVRVAGEADRWVIRVRDTGIGIAPAFLPFVFERFRQADGSLTREQTGLGLGLAIVKDLVELHGGSVAVTSEGTGRGSEFIVALPRLDLAPDAAVAPGMPPPSLDGMRVLVVDDNADALEIATEALAAAGASVTGVMNGAEAVAAWARQPFEVLLCDLAMPEMDGFQTLARIRELDEAEDRVTVAIALTAHASGDMGTRAAAAGFRQHLAKPADPAAILRAVAAAAGRS